MKAQGIFEYRPFPVAADEPLAAEHAALEAWAEEAVESLGADGWYKEVDLKSLPAGRALFDAKPPEARRMVLAGVAQLRHWDAEMERVRAQARDEMQRVNAHR